MGLITSTYLPRADVACAQADEQKCMSCHVMSCQVQNVVSAEYMQAQD